MTNTVKKMVRRNASETSIEAAKSVLKHVREIHQKFWIMLKIVKMVLQMKK